MLYRFLSIGNLSFEAIEQERSRSHEVVASPCQFQFQIWVLVWSQDTYVILISTTIFYVCMILHFMIWNHLGHSEVLIAIHLGT